MVKLRSTLILFIILILGAALRLYHNTDISLWHDEAFSALLIKYPWGEMMHRIGLDVHPPMYYIALRLWSYVFSDSLLALRGFSIFFGLATVVAAYAFVKAAFKNNKAALTAALLITISPFQIQYATEARMYTLGAFFAVLAAFFLVKALDKQRVLYSTLEIIYYLPFALSISIIILTHYYLLFTAAALCFYALAYHIYYYRWQFKRYYLLLITYLLIALSFLPWLKTFLFQFKQVGSGYWIPPMDRWSIPSTLWQIFVGLNKDLGQLSTKAWYIAVTVFTLFLLYRFIKKSTSPHKWLVILAFLSSFGGALLFLLLAKLKGETSSVYLVRYFLYASSFYLIMMAVWLNTIRIKQLAWVLVSIFAIANLGSFAHYWKELDISTKPGMNKAASFLEANVAQADKLYVGSSFEFFNLKYYVNQIEQKHQDIPQGFAGKFAPFPQPLLYSGGQRTIENMPHFAGTAILTNQDLVPYFEEAVKPNDIVWLLWTNGFGGSKPAIPSSWEQLDEKGFAEVRPYVGTWVIITEYKVR